MSTPSSFFLEPASANQRPSPFPPRYLKRQIYSEPSVFKAIDDHSINEARTNYRNFKDLMWNLIFKKHWNELEKARAIFRWMTTKNLYTIMFDSELPGSPEQVLGGFKDGKTTMAKIFECLANFAGLHCVTLSGWAKGVEYKPGMTITTTPPNHSWNAVFIDGNWQLVDSHWATRYLQSERNTPENLVYEYDDFYFLTEPSMLIYSHCPEEPAWQLLHPARGRKEYEDYPLVKSFFFSTGMQFLQQNRGIVFTKRGIVTLTLGFTQPTAFTFKLGYGDNSTENLQGIQLKRYVIQETTENRVTWYFRSPREGSYYMTMFAQPVAERVKVENVFKAACEYKIICDQAASDIRPFPLCSDANWGAGAPVRQYGLVPSQKTALLAAPAGRAEVSFTRNRDVRLFAKLVKDGMDEDTLEDAVSVREQENQVFVTVHLPTAGEYGLEVYANEPQREGDTYTHMCQYLVSFTDRDFGTLYGQVFDRSDLAYGMQANPELYSAPGGQYATLPAGGQYRPGPGGQQQNLSGQYAPGGQQELGGQYGPGGQQQNPSGQYAPGGQQATGGQYGRGNQQQNSSGQYAPGRQQGTGQYGPGGQQAGPYGGPGGQYGTGAGKQPYSTQDWDGTQLSGPKGYRDELQPGETGSHRQPGNQMVTKMEAMNIAGKKVPPGTAPKPGSGHYTDDIPPPPSDLGAHLYKQPPKVPDESNKKPLEIVYVTNITEKLPSSTVPRKSQDDDLDEAKRQPPIEIVYVPGAARSPHMIKKGDTLEGGDRSLTGNDTQKSELLYKPLGKKYPGEYDDGSNRGSPSIANKAGNYGDDFPPPPPTGEYPGSGVNKGGPGCYGGPKPYGMQDRSGSRYPNDQSGPRGTYEQSPAYGQGPYDQKQVLPVRGVPYPFGGDRDDDGFDSALPTEPEVEYKPHPTKTYTSSITVQAPASFRPIPIQEQQDPAPRPAPPAVPPKPFKDVGVFENVDTHAVEVSKEEHKNFRDLVWHLIYAREITNELEKARAIFLWLCSKDLQKLNFSNVAKGSPEEILMNLQRGQTTYAVVFEILCSYAGLHCKTISGYAKGAEYKPGMRFTGEQGQHSWNAVLVNGAWRLVDCHWAARRLVGKKITAENVRYELDEYYFMPDPHQLIFTHFPNDINWQLLERAISLADFENLVPVKSAFFKYGLQILGHREAVIHAKQEVTIRIGCPPFKSQALVFTFTLAYDNGKEEYGGTKLTRFGMQEMVEHVSFFTIRPPETGSYRLIIYAKDLDQSTKEGVYGGVCEYELICEAASHHPQPFPPCVHTSWGPGDSAVKYALTPLQQGAIFSTVNGLAEVRFHAPRELRFTAKLKSNEKDEKALAGFIMHRVVGDLAVFTVNAPSRGEFGLEIYANDPDADGNSLYHAYQYLIICADITGTVNALPTLPPGYLGPQPTFKKLGLTTTSHPDPYIQSDNGDLQVSFTLAQPLRMTSQLIFASNNRSDDTSDYILQQSLGTTGVTFFIKLPKTGLYKLQVYALPVADSSENLPGVFNYLINCTNTLATLVPYPKQYGQWKEGCYLYEPLDGQLLRNRSSKGNASTLQQLYFKIDVPKAQSVAIVIGEDWTQLEQKTGPGGSAWVGEASLEKHWGHESKVAVCANFGVVKASYSTLLEYSM